MKSYQAVTGDAMLPRTHKYAAAHVRFPYQRIFFRMVADLSCSLAGNCFKYSPR